MDSIRETLARYAHDGAWSGWMKYQFSKCTPNEDGTLTIPKWAVDRWTYQMNTPYDELPEEMKQSDREEADRIIEILGEDWISVDNHIAEFGIIVLVWSEDIAEIGMGQFIKARNKQGWHCVASTNSDYDGVWEVDDSITHWMPLPDPPGDTHA